MSEKQTAASTPAIKQESLKSVESVDALYAELTSYDPNILSAYVPTNAQEQKEAFLAGEIENPQHTYKDNSDEEVKQQIAKLTDIGERITEVADPKFTGAYMAFVEDYINKVHLLEAAQGYRNAESNTDKKQYAKRYENINEEIYGVPDEVTYRSLLTEEVQVLAKKQLTGSAAVLCSELVKQLKINLSNPVPERFKPKEETVAWMHTAVHSLYGNLLRHIPSEADNFTVEELQDVFTTIIREEFGSAAEDWQVAIEAANSIKVESTQRRIVIPEDRGILPKEHVERLVVHEIGVHMLRAVSGGEKNPPLLAQGLSGYYDFEEGLGIVMEQALEGKATERGTGHYITAGLVYHDKKDFRQTFEVKWRIAALQKLTEGQTLTEEMIDTARNTAYKQVMRIMRGTDELPFMKDLAYFNGSNEVWRYLEQIQGSDQLLAFALSGKIDPANPTHRRVILEASEGVA